MYIFQTCQNSLSATATAKIGTPFFASWNDCGSFSGEENFDCFGYLCCDLGEDVVLKF